MTRTIRSQKVDRIIRQAVVERGMSYEGAARWCEDEAERAAHPYREAAEEIRSWLARIPTRESEAS